MSALPIRRSGLLGIAVALAAAACAPASTSSATGQAPASQQTAMVTTNRPVPNVCESQVVVPADLAGVLAGPITAKTLPGDPQTCEFSANDSSSVSITVRPGLGDLTVSEWTSGKMPVQAGTIDSIGDRAAWQSTLRELIATKHNVLCDIGSQGAKGTDGELQKTFGGLCGKIWAAR